MNLSAFSLFVLPIMLLLRFILFSVNSHFLVQAVSWRDALYNWHHESQKSDDSSIKFLMESIDSSHDDFNTTLDAILKPRVPGTKNHEIVREYIIETMKSLDWNVEEDAFVSNTPHGDKPFSNIIATLNPKACRRLVLSCHYDSLVNREGTFVGATDSAVPCSMIIHLAKHLDSKLKKQEKRDDLTLQLIFFDGEEAFERWSKTDSLYGSRHLAQKWNDIRFPRDINDNHCKQYGNFSNFLESIDVLILLDLIGAPNPTFYSYFPDTYALYTQLVNIEQRLNSLNHLESQPPETNTRYFRQHSSLAYIEDDHIPFMKKGVPILHLIPSPFPAVWHRESDNRENLHHPTICNLNKIMFVFVSEYLHLF